MRNIIKMTLLVLFFNSCNAQDEFDLYKINFSENIVDLVKSNNMQIEDGKSDALTLFGFDRFQTSSENFLVFNGILLNENNNNKNNVVLHYSDDDKILAMYELNIYSEAEVKKLKAVLMKEIGEPSHNSKDEDDLEIIVWKNTNTKIYYFLMSYNNEDKSRKTELTVLDMKKKRSSEWIDFRSFKYFLD